MFAFFPHQLTLRALALACLAVPLGAADPGNAVEKLPAVVVSETPALADRVPLPQLTASVTGITAEETVNLVDAEDAVKYLPSIFLRKRNAGDIQPVLATRTWGVNSSARSLVYADGVLLSALIANNNSMGAPRWGMVAAAEIERVDLMYGPFAAAYPGNSMGAVVEITTRMPEKREAVLAQTEAWQDFSQYGTRRGFLTSQISAQVGNRQGGFSFWLTANALDSFSQPLTYVTAAAIPASTTGGYGAVNKLGQPAPVLGAAGLLHADMATLKVKTAYDFSPAVRATYSLGVWRNDTRSGVQTYLRDAAGQPTYAGVAGFAGGTYRWLEQHVMQSFTLNSAMRGNWDWGLNGSRYAFAQDSQRTPKTASATGTTVSAAGKVADLGGTGWSAVEARARWRPDGAAGTQELSFGLHDDRFRLLNPTSNTPDWTSGAAKTGTASEGDGRTETRAAWIQDIWRFLPGWQATLGARDEHWRAFGGYNANGATAVRQPELRAADFSPKATLGWTPAPAWTATLSYGGAARYPTAAELYQLVSTGTTFTSPNPTLRPEAVRAGEARLVRSLAQGSVRLALFQETVRDALISQYQPLVPGSSSLYQYVANVGRVRSRGVELALERKQFLVRGLELNGSVTYVDSRIVEDAGQGQFGGAVGKRNPYVPDWRMTAVATYRPRENLALALAGRYSGRQYSTVDNADVSPNNFGGFAPFFVLDAHVRWTLDRHWAISGGVDNLLNRKYFIFHPFPQRTVVAEVKYGF